VVVDLGGGTGDYAVHELVDGGKCKEIQKSSGGRWGSTAIDDAFIALLESAITPAVVAAFKVYVYVYVYATMLLFSFSNSKHIYHIHPRFFF
jgi:hypothetical protein